MHDQLRRRFWVEITLASASAALCLLTILWPTWIELLFKIDPDHANGSLEWLIVALSVAVTVTLAALARYEWRRRAPIPA